MSYLEEPAMLVQQPSSTHCQETTHLLVSTFRELYTQDGVNEETVRNLTASKRSNNTYQDRYVEKLQQIQDSWSQKVSQVEGVLFHLEEASNKALFAEQEELRQELDKYESYEKLGLPPVSSKLHLFLQKDLLRSHNLIVANNFRNLNDISISASVERSLSTPQYMQPTRSSRMHFEKSQAEDNYLPEPGPILPYASTISKNNSKFSDKMAVSKPKLSMPEKDVWKDSTNPYQREMERKAFLKLQSTFDFLKNPRFTNSPKSLLVKPVQKPELRGERVDFIRAYPSPVVFREYKSGDVYEIKIEFQNMTSSCRQIRVMQPKTSYFAVSHGEFPSENGLVAPGMSCYYIIRFTPDSLADFDDVLEVKTPSAEELMIIKLQGRREKPKLTLPNVLDCGPSVVGDVKAFEYQVRNEGGAGKFCFKLAKVVDETTEIDWEEISAKCKGEIKNEVFSMSPTEFTLDNNESIVIQVAFKPTALKSYSLELELFCDNSMRTSYLLEGSGEMANVKLSYDDSDVRAPLPGETFGMNSIGILEFQDQNPEVKSVKEIQIKNDITIPLKYHWEILTPSASSNDTCINTESAFSIYPQKGCLEKNAIAKFSCQFYPFSVGSFYDDASLVLENIPKLLGEAGEYVSEDQSAVKISLRGNAKGFSILPDPPVVFFNGKLFIEKPYTQSIMLHNRSFSTASFSWESYADSTCSITVEPSQGEIDTDSSMIVDVIVRGHEPGKISVLLNYVVPHCEENRGLFIEADFVGSNLQIEESLLNFSLVQLGHHANEILTLYNDSPVVATWGIRDWSGSQFDFKSDFQFFPVKGVLAAYEKQSVAVHFQPRCVGTVCSYIECFVDKGKSCYIAVHSEVQCPLVVLERSVLNIDEAFLNVPTQQKVTLINTTLLRTSFKWNESYNRNNEEVSRTFQPTCGVLEPHQKLDVVITMIFHKLGSANFVSCCEITEAVGLLFLSVSTNVLGLAVDYAVPNMNDVESSADDIRTSKVIDFGENAILGKPVSCLLLLENQSAIKTTFSIVAESFPPARLPTPPTVERDVKKKTRPLLCKTANIADYDSKTDELAKKEFANNALRDGNGVAFLCVPDCGDLDPFEKKVITVTSFSDMWGEYFDTLVCKIDNLDDILIAVHIDVIGCPLNFQMSREQPPVIRFGSHVSGSSAIHRSIRINNISHVDIRLDWSSYVIDPSDDQLINLNVFIGNPLPLLDPEGNEIDDSDNSDGGNLIAVMIDEHHGKNSNVPFKVLNTQMIIPALDNRNVNVCFIPAENVREGTDYFGYALAYMSLKEQDKFREGKFSRLDGLDTLPFALNLNGTAKPAKVFIEACDDGSLLFELSATEILERNGLPVRSTRRFILVNNSGAAILCRLRIEEPFNIILIDTGKEKFSSTKKSISLKPTKHVEITIAFEITHDIVLKALTSNKINRLLEILFDNNTVQTFEFTGVVHYPSLDVSTSAIDFETCYIQNTTEKCFQISNPSKATLFWTVKFDDNCSKHSKEIFQVSPREGRVEAYYSQSQSIKIQFTPRHNLEYCCELLISSVLYGGYLTDSPVRIALHGEGSYDEKYATC